MTKDLGGYLRRARNEKGLTLRDAENRTGVSNAYLSQLENGRIRSPSPTILHKLSELYEVSYEQLMKMSGYPINEKTQRPAFRLSEDLDNLTPEEKEKLVEYIQFLKSRRRK